KYMGVENLTIDTTNAPDDNSYNSNIQALNVDSFWVRNIRSLNSRRAHVYPVNCSHCEIRDSYFFGTKNAATQSYGIGPFPWADSLIENNIFQQVSAPVLQVGSGSVISYNFSINELTSVTSFMGWTYPSHDPGVSYNLFEGNILSGFSCDDT